MAGVDNGHIAAPEGANTVEAAQEVQLPPGGVYTWSNFSVSEHEPARGLFNMCVLQLPRVMEAEDRRGDAIRLAAFFPTPAGTGNWCAADAERVYTMEVQVDGSGGRFVESHTMPGIEHQLRSSVVGFSTPNGLFIASGYYGASTTQFNYPTLEQIMITKDQGGNQQTLIWEGLDAMEGAARAEAAYCESRDLWIISGGIEKASATVKVYAKKEQILVKAKTAGVQSPWLAEPVLGLPSREGISALLISEANSTVVVAFCFGIGGNPARKLTDAVCQEYAFHKVNL